MKEWKKNNDLLSSMRQIEIFDEKNKSIHNSMYIPWWIDFTENTIF